MEQQNNKEHLHILWTNADVTTAKLMVMMYARNAMKNGWWKEVTVIFLRSDNTRRYVCYLVIKYIA